MKWPPSGSGRFRDLVRRVGGEDAQRAQVDAAS